MECPAACPRGSLSPREALSSAPPTPSHVLAPSPTPASKDPPSPARTEGTPRLPTVLLSSVCKGLSQGAGEAPRPLLCWESAVGGTLAGSRFSRVPSKAGGVLSLAQLKGRVGRRPKSRRMGQSGVRAFSLRLLGQGGYGSPSAPSPHPHMSPQGQTASVMKTAQ